MKSETVRLLLKRRKEINKELSALRQEKKTLNAFLKGNGIKRKYAKRKKL